MNVFITGAGGFLGKYIIRNLLQKESLRVFGTSLFDKDLQEFCGQENFSFVPNNAVLDFDFSVIDVVVNCAFPRAMDGAGFANGLDYLNELLRRIEPHKNCGLIDISSQSVYSVTRQEPANEQTQRVLEAAYDVGKYCMEMLVDARLKDHKRVHLRLASLIGPKFDQRLVNKFVKKVIAGEDIVLKGGKQLFGFLDVRDCADAICTVVNQWDRVTDAGEIFNIGAEDSNSLLRIAEIAVAVGKEFGFEKTKIILNETDDWMNSSLDSTKFYRYFDWKPCFEMKDSIHAIYHAEMT